ncbi:MAG: flagellar basal body-associated FliL family protein, partial [Pseudomonadota bacterium]
VIKQAGPVLARAELPSLTTKKVGRKTHVELPDYLVDLSPDRRGRVAYLKLSASLVFDDGKNPQSLIQFADLEPFVSERTVMLLRTLRPEDFQGSEKISFLKAEMLRRANLVLGVNGAEDVVIRSLVIQ